MLKVTLLVRKIRKLGKWNVKVTGIECILKLNYQNLQFLVDTLIQPLVLNFLAWCDCNLFLKQAKTKKLLLYLVSFFYFLLQESRIKGT